MLHDNIELPSIH